MRSLTRRCKQGLAGLVLGMTLSCTPQSALETGELARQTLHFGDCTGALEIPRRPLKLQATRITVLLDESCAPDVKLTVAMDMPEMPMHVAPVTLTPTGPRSFEGVVMFTMSGRWRVEIRAQGSSQSGKDSFDVDAG